MARRVEMSVEVAGFRLEYGGGAELFETVVRGAVGPLARGEWRPSGNGPGIAPSGLLLPDSAPPSPEVPPPSPAPASAFAPAPLIAPASDPAAAAPDVAAAWDPGPLYARLAKEEGRRAERDAVLLALVSLAVSGKRDSAPAEVVAHMEAHGFPSGDIKPRPVLAKLCHRKGMAVPGVLPNTFRATPAGSAYIWRKSREG